MPETPSAPFRVLTAVALCDGHDAAIVGVSRALRHEGLEVIYLGFNKSPAQIVRAAIEEDVDAIGISSYNGGHMEFLEDVLNDLRAAGVSIPVVAGGGGTITGRDTEQLKEMGIAEVFAPGMALWDIAKQVRAICAANRADDRQLDALVDDLAAGKPNAIARALSIVEDTAQDFEGATKRPFVIGVSGNGGAGKSTLIDELLLRFSAAGKHRVAVVCCDPTTSRNGGGALLGDRIRMLAADKGGVYIRSLATRNNPGGVSGALGRAVKVLSAAPFDVIVLESAGIGQADNPFDGLVDLNVYVMTSEFGSALQLEKTVMLEQADIVVLNKCDQPASAAALKTIRARLRAEGRPFELLGVTAVRHRDEGVDKLHELLEERIGR
ncbi:cobalamin-dependent protein [bacterium]|nr:cobalamin-dependent protein [bacterium]